MLSEILEPATVAEAIAALGGPHARAIAGGTDLLPDLEEGRLSAERLVSLARLPWRTIERRGDRLLLGSTLPMRAIELYEGLGTELPGLLDAVRSVGSVPLRHRATVGGNIARAAPTSDLLPILLALDAQLDIVGPGGARSTSLDRVIASSRRVAIAPQELVAAVSVPARARSAYLWQRVRPANDISQVGVAVARPEGSARWAVALGGVLPRPVRVPGAEELLGAARPDAEARAAAARVASEAAPFATDRRAAEWYRRRVLEVLVRRALERALGPDGGG